MCCAIGHEQVEELIMSKSIARRQKRVWIVLKVCKGTLMVSIHV
jgi:hypothetical protein